METMNRPQFSLRCSNQKENQNPNCDDGSQFEISLSKFGSCQTKILCQQTPKVSGENASQVVKNLSDLFYGTSQDKQEVISIFDPIPIHEDSDSGNFSN
jgi:hypothetical protein